MKILQTEQETKNLRLTAPYLTDAEAMYEALSDAEIFRYNAWRRHETPVETFAFVNNLLLRHENGDAEWVIREKENDKALGIICLRETAEDGCAEIGFWLNRRYHGRGYGGEAVEKIVRFGFDICGLSKIEAFCHPENTISLKILHKNGFNLEKEEINTFTGPDFKNTDVILKLSAFN